MVEDVWRSCLLKFYVYGDGVALVGSYEGLILVEGVALLLVFFYDLLEDVSVDLLCFCYAVN